jgi:hypothetical protein
MRAHDLRASASSSSAPIDPAPLRRLRKRPLTPSAPRRRAASSAQPPSRRSASATKVTLRIASCSPTFPEASTNYGRNAA